MLATRVGSAFSLIPAVRARLFPTGKLKVEDGIKVIDLSRLPCRELWSLVTKFGIEGLKANSKKNVMVEALRSVQFASAPEQHR